MTDLQVCRVSAMDRPLALGRRNEDRRARLWAWLTHRGRPPFVLRHVASVPEETEAAARPTLGEMTRSIASSARLHAGELMTAYVASAVDIALEVEALDDGAPIRRTRTPVHDLVAETIDALQPCAVIAGAKLVHDGSSAWMCTAWTDPGRLRKALSHLVLRALSTPGEGGAVRLSVASEPTGARISVLSTRATRDPGLFDLTALMRLLRAIDGVVVLEPARAGCTALSILLPRSEARVSAFGDSPPPQSRRDRA